MIPGLATLVAWAEGPDLQDDALPCNPYNVFCRLVGGFALDVQNGHTDTVHPGILPPLYPHLFPSRSRLHPSPKLREGNLAGLTEAERGEIAAQYREAAVACGLLAELVSGAAG